ncbi:VRR-NUC domain-containing protein, partial [Brevundimonas sp.]|uniref:VRR-NUC domain-containing protein n=1 Tax=Brevundimonas sp. TaxID=1871086 RepID=UPI00356154FE
EGVSAGAPDWMLFAPREGRAGLALEFKSATGRVSPAQAGWHAALRQEAWTVHIVKSAAAAWEAVTDYLGIRA